MHHDATGGQTLSAGLAAASLYLQNPPIPPLRSIQPRLARYPAKKAAADWKASPETVKSSDDYGHVFTTMAIELSHDCPSVLSFLEVFENLGKG